ncbi:MAG: nuclear transport factor 2 family protein [Dokdonella sp.]
MKRLTNTAFACLLLVANVAIAAGKTPDEAGVRDAENQWSEAFISGNIAALDALLDTDYVSTGTNGKARAKEEIIRISGTYAKAHPGEHAKPLSPTSTIRVIGDAAVVQHHNSGDTSVDVFYFRDGHWHAWYSQHTKIEG